MRSLYSFVILGVLAGAGLVEAREVRDLEEVVAVEKGQTVRIDIPVAELRIEATDRDDIRIEMTARCRWQLSDCESALQDLEIRSRASSRRTTVELTGTRRWHGSLVDLEGTVEIPRSSALEVEMGVADLEIRGVERDLSVDIGVGKLDLRLPAARIGEAFVDVGIGKVRFHGAGELEEDRRSFLVGNEVHWADGTGEAELEIEVGVGEVRVRLE
jgi:hypothetical protein